MTVRINITISEEDLKIIDDTATKVGETRSEYLSRAGLMRADKLPKESAKLKKIKEDVKKLARDLDD